MGIKEIHLNSDLNNILTQGIYSSYTNCTNIPIQSGLPFVLIVIVTNYQYSQIFLARDTQEVYVRFASKEGFNSKAWTKL